MTRPADHEQESRRILERIEQETAPGGSYVARSAARMQNHLSANDVDQSDRIEVWGTRIGRAIALVITAAILLWFLSYLTGG